LVPTTRSECYKLQAAARHYSTHSTTVIALSSQAGPESIPDPKDLSHFAKNHNAKDSMSSNNSSYERSVALISAFLFGTSSLWLLRQLSRERERKAKSGQANPLTIGYVRDGKVSHRCMRALSPSTPYLMSFLRGLEYPCDPTLRPDGFIAFCMAENKLVMDVLSERLQHFSTTQAAFSDPTVYCYNSFLGLPVARQAASYFLAKRFLLTDQQHEVTLEQALQRIRPAHIGIGAGAVALLNGLFYLLGEEGDACLIPAPYYAAFESDMSVVSGIVPFAVHMANPTQGPSENELDLAHMEAKSVSLETSFHQLEIFLGARRLTHHVVIFTTLHSKG
jgi:hypothetical protein